MGAREMIRYLFAAALLVFLSWSTYHTARQMTRLYTLIKANEQVIENTRHWVEDIEKQQCRPPDIIMESTFDVM